jgi:mannose-6-phosphate isomerase
VAIEYTFARTVPKPWGVLDLRPYSNPRNDGNTIGEIWYERSGAAAADPALLLKLLFTTQPLSIQVHPDDAYAQSIGLRNGKTEAWYVLNANPGAKIALGLKQRVTPQQLRASIDDGSIANLVAWHSVSAGDVVSVPGGSIHAIGAGLVIAEIQQRSDATFRLFDYGRQRDLHVENAVAAADTAPAHFPKKPLRCTSERTLLAASSHFVLERIELTPNSAWSLEAERETWFLVLAGNARAASFDIAIGNAIFAQSDRLDIHVGPAGMVGLVAYSGGDAVYDLLRRINPRNATDKRSLREVPV